MTSCGASALRASSRTALVRASTAPGVTAGAVGEEAGARSSLITVEDAARALVVADGNGSLAGRPRRPIARPIPMSPPAMMTAAWVEIWLTSHAHSFGQYT